MSITLQPEAFLWVLTEPGAVVTLDEFHDWYDNEHVPLRMSKIPEFLTGARYVAIDGKQPSFSAFYNISVSDLFNQSKYTDLRKYRSQREAEIFARISALDRRAYQVIETECHIRDTEYSPVIVTVECPAFDEAFANLQKLLKTHPSCRGSQTCKIIDHSLVGTVSQESSSAKDRVSTCMTLFEFEDESFRSISQFQDFVASHSAFVVRIWKLYRGWKNTSGRVDSQDS